MAERWRCFVASPIGEDLRATLAAAVERWRSRPELEELRWTDPNAWHLTLAFLGPTDPARVPEIVAALVAMASRHAPMELHAEGVGAFPAPGRARVAWYGVDDRHGRLASLAGDVAAALGLEVTTPYRPHLTLARASRSTVDLRGWLTTAAAPVGELRIGKIALMRSHLTRLRAEYEELASVPLGPAPP